MIIKKLKDKYEELLHLPYPDMSGKLYTKDVITNQEKLEINNLIGERQMERVLDIIIQSLKCNDTAKYKGFLKAMEESDDLLLRNKAEKLGKWIVSCMVAYVVLCTAYCNLFVIQLQVSKFVVFTFIPCKTFIHGYQFSQASIKSLQQCYARKGCESDKVFTATNSLQ